MVTAVHLMSNGVGVGTQVMLVTTTPPFLSLLCPDHFFISSFRAILQNVRYGSCVVGDAYVKKENVYKVFSRRPSDISYLFEKQKIFPSQQHHWLPAGVYS